VLVCKFCGSERKNKNSLSQHQNKCRMNEQRVLPKIDYKNKKKGRDNTYTKAKKLGLPVPVSACKGRPGHRNTKHSHGFKEKQRLNALKRNLGGITQSRWIKYKGKTLGSSYELAVAEELDRNGIKWDTCNRFEYIDNSGKKRTYTPDIFLIDYNVYLDPKNDFLIHNQNPKLGFRDDEKIKWVCEQNNIKVLILNKNQLQWDKIKKLL